jgi:hypothetical protein
MTPDEIRKKYRFPERVEGKLEWRFYPKRLTSPNEYLAIVFHPKTRSFDAAFWRDGFEYSCDPSPLEALRAALPAVAIAQCTAASLQLENPRS